MCVCVCVYVNVGVVAVLAQVGSIAIFGAKKIRNPAFSDADDDADAADIPAGNSAVFC